jgi:hypothetical protein
MPAADNPTPQLSANDLPTGWGSGKIPTGPQVQNNMIPYADAVIASSTAIPSTTTTPTAFDKAPATIPANFLKAGDIIRVKVGVTVVFGAAGDQFDWSLRFGSVTLASGSNLAAAGSGTSQLALQAEMVVRSIGATGAVLGSGPLAIPTAATFAFATLSGTIDTTAAIVPAVYWNWDGTPDAAATATLTYFSIEIVRKVKATTDTV